MESSLCMRQTVGLHGLSVKLLRQSAKGSSAVADSFQINREEIDRLRKLVPERPDFHLSLWGAWCRSDTGIEGYPTHSTCLEGLGGIAAAESSDHAYERESSHWAEVSDSCIRALPFELRMAISHVYESSVWRFRSTELLEANLTEAARLFWIDGQRRGLV